MGEDRKSRFDEQVRRWCITSLEHLHSRGTDLSDSAYNAEWLIEAAAFVKLVQTRNRNSNAAIDFLCTRTNSCTETLTSLVALCPAIPVNTPEILGSIHEFFVAQSHESNGANKKAKTAGLARSRKANGVFYTPESVATYMVRETVGRQLEQATPERAAQFKILDPAAGSGSFLLAAFRYLVEWHLKWYMDHSPEKWPSDVVMSGCGWKLTPQRCWAILQNNLYGVDLDANAIEVTRRTLWLASCDSSCGADPLALTDEHWSDVVAHFQQGHALIGSAFGEANAVSSKSSFKWSLQFPTVAVHGGFDVIVGNPPYRRERNFKQELDEIAATPLGRFQSARMDLWYYFVHRGLELLRAGGTLAFITSAYWIRGKGADKLIAALRDDVHLDELFLLRDQPVFPGIQGHHLIFRLTKSNSDQPTTIRVMPGTSPRANHPFLFDPSCARTFTKSYRNLFRDEAIDVMPDAQGLHEKFAAFPCLNELGVIRQGIAENPAAINRQTIERFRDDPSSSHWKLGAGVFSLRADEVERLSLALNELALLRPYHDLCDLGRYWSAAAPSRQLVYSTKQTCPDIDDYPVLHRHLSQYRTILDARRETQSGSNRWWHLHWPRDEDLWRANKLIALQMATRPSFVPRFEPTYVSFSTNVFVPNDGTQEDLRYLCGLLNSRLLWSWFERHAKHRGIGLEINGHTLARAPIRRIDFENQDDVRKHDDLVWLVDQRMRLSRLNDAANAPDHADNIAATELQIDSLVSSLYLLDPTENELVNAITKSDFS